MPIKARLLICETVSRLEKVGALIWCNAFAAEPQPGVAWIPHARCLHLACVARDSDIQVWRSHPFIFGAVSPDR